MYFHWIKNVKLSISHKIESKAPLNYLFVDDVRFLDENSLWDEILAITKLLSNFILNLFFEGRGVKLFFSIIAWILSNGFLITHIRYIALLYRIVLIYHKLNAEIIIELIWYIYSSQNQRFQKFKFYVPFLWAYQP